MTSGLRTAIVASTLSALILAPAIADAQGRRATGRVARPRTSVVVGVGPRYYRPYYYYDPFFFGGFYGSYWYSPYYYSPFYYGYGQYPYYGGRYYDTSSSLRMQVTPRETEVYIDGYFAGTVDDFDGVFQRLHLEPGEHNVQLYLPGHRNFSEKVYLQPGGTFRVRHTMEPLRSGDPEPVKPSAQAQPPGAGSQARTTRRPVGPPPTARDRDRDRDRDQDQDRDRAANADFGSVSLRVQPGEADVTIDGERWEGPADNDRLTVQLSAGTHHIQIRKDGYRTYNTDVNVRRGETTPLNVALTKQ